MTHYDSKINSVTLLGSSSGRNAGDAALMSGIMETIDTACGKQVLYEIPTIRSKYVRENYTNRVHPISMMPWHLSLKIFGLPTYKSILRTDLSLVFDAVLFDRSLYNPLFNFLSSFYLMMPRAKKKGKRMAFFNVGAGPVDTPTGRRMLQELAENMDFISVRDQDSLDLLRDIGVKNPRMFLAADSALVVPPANAERINEIMKSVGFSGVGEFLAINVNTYIDTWARPRVDPMGREKFVQIYSTALNNIIDKLRVPILFVCTQHDDVQITEEIRNRLKKQVRTATVSNANYNHYEIKGILGRASLLCAMRLHAMILASSELTPIVGIAYQPKCSYYFGVLGKKERILSFQNFSEAALTDLILDGWKSRHNLKSRLEERIPVLKNEALKPGALVSAMNRGEDLNKIIAGFEVTQKTHRVQAA